MTAQSDRLLTSKEAAAFLGVAVGTLCNWRVMKSGPVYQQIGGNKKPTIRYKLSDLQNYVREVKPE